MTTSARARRRRRTAAPSGCFRSRAMPRLLRFIMRKAADWSPMLGGTMRRVSSPSGMRSTLMTSAPMSASMSPQTGPAMMWASSITLTPASGPGAAMLLASPVGLALVEEGVHPLAEILAHVAHEDEVPALFRPEPHLEAAQRFLGRAERQRRMAGDGARQFLGARHERRVIGQDLIDEADRLRLLRLDEARREDDVLGARGADEALEPRAPRTSSSR